VAKRKINLEKFKKLLLDERDRLISSISNAEQTSRTEADRDHGQDMSDYAELGTDNFHLETILSIASNDSERLREVMDALQRIEKGTYGICEGSGKPIPIKRLEAIPSARYCIEYQNELESQSSPYRYR
jgi:RNA polymerase-binding protein DksA